MEDEPQVSMRIPQPPPEGWECEVVEEGDGLAIAMGDKLYAHVEAEAEAANLTMKEFLTAVIEASLDDLERKETDDGDPVQ